MYTKGKCLVSNTAIIVNVNMKRQISLSGSRGIRSLQPAQDLVIECFYLKKIVLCFKLLSFSLLKSRCLGDNVFSRSPIAIV